MNQIELHDEPHVEGLEGRWRKPVDETPRPGLPDDQVDSLVLFLKVLADRTRLRILGLLAEREYTVKEIAAELGLTEPTISQHLGMLRWRVKMVEMRRDGVSHYYRLKQDGIHALLRQISDQATQGLGADADESEQAVLKQFFHYGQLKEIPVKHSSLRIVLHHLAREFRFQQEYPEREVNVLLKRFHPDYAALRRGLVDFGFMARKNGIYWRLEESAAAHG